MANFKVIKMVHMSPLHIGTGKENYDFSASSLQSDTLSAALASLRCVNGKASGIEHFLSSFTISSAFPFKAGRFYLPRPQGRLTRMQVKGVQENEYRKQLKKIKFIDYELWKDLAEGKTVEVSPCQLQGNVVTNSDEPIKISCSQVIQRVQISHDSDDAEPFFFEWRFFQQDAGLFCLVDADEEVFKEICELFIQLGDTGLGTDKSIGGGKFGVEVDTLELPSVPDSNATMLLSLYVPTEDELPKLHLSESRYTILSRSGFMAGSIEPTFCHLRKRSIYMFDYGSVFPTTADLKGKIVDLRPRWNDSRMHPVFRSGKPFVAKIKL